MGDCDEFCLLINNQIVRVDCVGGTKIAYLGHTIFLLDM